MTEVATDMRDERHWHAVHTRSRLEKAVAGLLDGNGVTRFLPLRRVLSRWADRKKWVEKPLFPGYLFVHVSREQLPTVRSTRGVARLLGPEPFRPSIVPDAEVQSIRSLVASGVRVAPWPYLKPGQLVRVIDGPLRGIQGTLIRKGRRHLLVISVNLLGRSVAAEVAAGAVRACRMQEAQV
ncbi:MAG: UpxY family transcription antiterminator [Candidatus Brocadiae bacterium]|nr:UpxY family transcription antiterminator [Candidatus Brocadiia bacterium]